MKNVIVWSTVALAILIVDITVIGWLMPYLVSSADSMSVVFGIVMGVLLVWVHFIGFLSILYKNGEDK